MLDTNISQFHSHYNPTQIPGERKNGKMKKKRKHFQIIKNTFDIILESSKTIFRLFFCQK